MLRPLTLPLRKMRMPRLCSSRTILTATSLFLAQPTTAQNPGMRPSTSWMPQARSWMSSMGPLSFILSPCTRRSPPVKRSPSSPARPRWMICGSCLRAKRTPSMTSSANNVATPASRVSPRYGSHSDPAGSGCSRAAGSCEHRRQVAELLDLDAGERVDHRQVVGGVRERHRGIGAELGEGGLHLGLRLAHEGGGAADRVRGDVAAHQASPSPCVCPSEPCS